jgi:hypothetical protein
MKDFLKKYSLWLLLPGGMAVVAFLLWRAWRSHTQDSALRTPHSALETPEQKAWQMPEPEDPSLN